MNDKERQLSGIVDCVRKTVTREGPLAFYKGFGMCWTRVGGVTNDELIASLTSIRRLVSIR